MNIKMSSPISRQVIRERSLDRKIVGTSFHMEDKNEPTTVIPITCDSALVPPHLTLEHPDGIEAIARISNKTGEQPAIQYRVETRFFSKRICIPDASRDAEKFLTNKLINSGLEFKSPEHKAEVLKYIASAKPESIALVVDSAGYLTLGENTKAFAFANNVLAVKRKPYENISDHCESIIQSGAVDGWKNCASESHKDHDSLTLIAVAFAAPLLQPLDHPSFAIALFGDSILNTEMTSKIAGSIFNSPSISDQGLTEAALFKKMIRNQDLPSFISQLSTSNLKVLTQALGMAGITSASSPLAKKSPIRTIISAPTEKDFFESQIQMRKPLFDESHPDVLLYPCRTIKSEVSGSQIWPVKSRVRMCDVLSDQYGVVGPAYLQTILDNLPTIQRNGKNLMAKYCERWVMKYKLNRENIYISRACKHFAILKFALICAGKFKLAPWAEKDIADAFDQIFLRWLEYYEETNISVEDRVLQMFKKFFQQKQSNAFTSLEMYSGSGNHGKAGLVTGKGEAKIYLFWPEFFKDKFLSQFASVDIFNALEKHGLLIHDKENKQQQRRIPGAGGSATRLRFYVIHSKIMTLDA
ncbi:MAG: DUF927 domain-containing protein [Undibacterium sp.]|nr:DUF927 domain-containing protein [Undibacterium sp.]